MKEMIVWIGPTHSEKSTRAAQAARRYARLGNKVLLLRPRCSIRPHPRDPSMGDRPGMLVTKGGMNYPSTEFDSLDELESLSDGADVVWIDEIMLAAGQEPGKQGKAFDSITRIRKRSIVLISALSATSELEVFTDLMGRLLAVADEIIQCRADCDCCGAMSAATRSFYVPGDKEGQVEVGGEDIYEALCPSCWTKKSKGMCLLP